MSGSLLFATMLLVGSSTQDALARPGFNEAVQMAAEGRDPEALAAFRALAARNPNDREARLWIARLHERMGHPDLAEPVYRSVLLEDSTSTEAALGLASTLLARHEAAEAIELLRAVEDRSPQNAAVFELLGRAHDLEGRPRTAIDYFERATSLMPTRQHRRQLEEARRVYLHRLETRGFSEQFDGSTPDGWNGDLAVNFRLKEGLRLIARGEAQRKFAASEQRGGGGLEWRWRPRTILRGQAIIGVDTVIMPELDYLGEIEHTHGTAVWIAGIRHFGFTGARTTFLTPAVNWLASERL